jgi:aspartyl-tRNA synthetase
LSETIEEVELDQWRRTHLSSDIRFCSENDDVIIMGWISSIRDHGNLHFIMVRDRIGETQVVAKKGECPDLVFSQIRYLKEHTSLAIKGRIKYQSKSPSGVEVVPLEIRVFSLVTTAAPFMIQGNRSSIGIDTRLDLRAVDLRRKILQSIFRIRYTSLNSVREFLAKEGFLEVNTPKMIATATEGGAALFPIFYYDREAFLAQSPQLYKEQLTMSFENVYEIGPIFRAEPSRTNRHLSEAISIDVEMAFSDYHDAMQLLEKMISHIVNAIKTKNKDEIESSDLVLPDIDVPLPKYSYDEILESLNVNDGKIRWGDDLSPQALKSVASRLDLNNYYFITDWPASIKPFYVKPDSKNEAKSESFDLMFGPLEISSGSTRINRKTELVNRMRRQGLNIQKFDYHLKAFDYGVPPHSGFGVGLERFLMSITKLENIRDASLYPRDIDRLTP